MFETAQMPMCGYSIWNLDDDFLNVWDNATKLKSSLLNFDKHFEIKDNYVVTLTVEQKCV